ncbi:GTP 3',8-cyclase MoaA [Pelosinus sp. IPA-1]|uniref:GTP 3',8-cyclase MoaA n=1 Tax=Pelosinus sp. IPA-1 TaxID=3029569 RepID=UPI002436188A|nr:GTP 3',8-cyclase MoaA [Pelosinus sp. IPA-1]GMB02244.1 GTP 3',8-cyclase [Pelosinus sp. IPA-1]
MGIIDSYGRNIRYLRVSVTDKCNFRCSYCMPAGNTKWFPEREILSYDELLRMIRIAVKAGITKIRITGGEPLVRKDLIPFIAEIRKIPGIQDLSMTTNGSLLSQYALQLKKAGLDRVNISLDTLREDRFNKITERSMFRQVLMGIKSAEQAGFTPIKLNVVVMNGINTDELIDFARLSFEKSYEIRFIEYMQFNSDSRNLLVPTKQIKATLNQAGWGTLVEQPGSDGPATVFRFPGSQGSIGFISATTEHFCNQCNRIRLTADGRLKPCLLSNFEIDIKRKMRAGATDFDIENRLRLCIWQKSAQHGLDGKEVFQRGMFQTGG